MQTPERRLLHADDLFDGDRWRRDVTLEIDAGGDILAVNEGRQAGAERANGIVLPGMINLHSHAFQRVMAGLGERQADPDDSFWSWRDVMYRVANRIGPDEVEAIATWLYIEMLKSGYTGVCEFHYLHHAPGGHRYADRAELSRRHIAAAATSGLGLTLLPVLYQRGGFDGRPLAPHQLRFGHDTDEFLDLLATLDPATSPQVSIGLAIHSLRAVPLPAIRTVVTERGTGPVHIHVAEQLREVDECRATTGYRPVQWLCRETPVDHRWCLVHATHLDEQEVTAIAGSRAVVGLCPTTEGNLGDGLFPLAPFAAAGGAWGVGSDSHVSVNPIEELRWLEYGQRLLAHRRNVVASQRRPEVGAALWSQALAGGTEASGRPVGRIAAGCRADLIVADTTGVEPADDRWLSRLVFADGAASIRDVMVGGQWCVRDGRHGAEDSARTAFLEVFRRILD